MSATQQQALRSAVASSSSVPIEAALRDRLRGRAKRYDRWLTSKHAFLDPISAVRLSPLDAAAVADYTAAAAPTHLFDGWSYLARAFDAIANGDRGPAIHLAYYAELRASFALLATQGISILRNKHTVIDGNGVVRTFGGSTHEAAWLCMHAWSGEPAKVTGLLDVISVEGATLSEWLSRVGATTPAQAHLAQKWLRAWSIDLKLAADDQETRNESSYPPTRVRPDHPPFVASEHWLQPLVAAWEALEPATQRAGASIDLRLLLSSLRYAFDRGMTNAPTWPSLVDSLDDLPRGLESALPSGHPDGFLFKMALKTAPARSATATPTLARALLLLRVATAFVESMLHRAGASSEELRFWWVASGSDAGFWVDPSEFESMADLWIDVEEALDRLQAACSSKDTTAQAALAAFDSARPAGQFLRAPYWLLGL